MLHTQDEEEPEVEYVEGYEMEDDGDAMEDFGKGANGMSDSEDGKFSCSVYYCLYELFIVLSSAGQVLAVYHLVTVPAALFNELPS